MKTYIKKLVRRIWGSPIYGALLLQIDCLAFWVAGMVPRASAPRYTLLVAPSGQGNIGDQAMFDSYLENTSGPIVAVVARDGAFTIEERYASRIRAVVLPNLIRGLPPRRFGDVVRFTRLLRGAGSLVVPGADTVDGGHPQASLARLNLIHLAIRANVPSAVLGFSWAPDIPASVLESMRELNGRTLLYPRDPLSHRRLIASGIDKATASADLVFSYNLFEKVPDPVQAWIERQAAAGRRVVLLNVSGLVARKIDLSHDYAALLAHLHALDAAVLFLPHVFRSGSNDLEQCVRLFSSHGGANDLLVEDILAPAQIKTLASAAYMTVTGRMHLAIMSLSSAVPTITLATAGKVEGLYEFFDLGKLVVEPLNGVGQEICDRVGDIWTDRSAFSDRIEEALAGVRVLSSTNFGDREIAHQGNA